MTKMAVQRAGDVKKQVSAFVPFFYNFLPEIEKDYNNKRLKQGRIKGGSVKIVKIGHRRKFHPTKVCMRMVYYSTL